MSMTRETRRTHSQEAPVNYCGQNNECHFRGTVHQEHRTSQEENSDDAAIEEANSPNGEHWENSA